MAASLPEATAQRHRVIPEIEPEMVKATLRKPEVVDFLAEIGRCLFRARSWLGWTLEELAGRMPPPSGSDKRDPRQVRRWEQGEERPQVDVIFAVEELREPFVVQLAKLSGADVETCARFRKVG